MKPKQMEPRQFIEFLFFLVQQKRMEFDSSFNEGFPENNAWLHCTVHRIKQLVDIANKTRLFEDLRFVDGGPIPEFPLVTKIVDDMRRGRFLSYHYTGSVNERIFRFKVKGDEFGYLTKDWNRKDFRVLKKAHRQFLTDVLDIALEEFNKHQDYKEEEI